MPERRPEITGWFRRLEGDRLEIYLKVERVRGVEDRKIRASGPEEEMFELVTWFEEKTGMQVSSPTWRRVRSGPKQIPGQIGLAMEELSSPHATVPDDAS